MGDNQEELEKVMQENVKKTETFSPNKNKVTRFNNLCIIKRDWKFQNQLMITIIILSLGSIMILLVVIIPFISYIAGHLITIQPSNFDQIEKCLNISSQKIEKFIQLKTAQNGRFINSSKLLIGLYFSQEHIMLNLTNPYLINEPNNQSQNINNIVKQDLQKYPNLYTQYNGDHNQNSKTQFAFQYSQLFATGLLQVDSASILFNEEKVLLSLPVNISQSKDYAHTIIDQMIQQVPMNISDIQKIVTIRSKISKNVYLPDQFNIQYIKDIQFFSKIGVNLQNQESFMNTNFTGYTQTEWDNIIQLIENKIDSNSNCNNSQYQFLDHRAICIYNKLSKEENIVLARQITGKKNTNNKIILLMFLNASQIIQINQQDIGMNIFSSTPQYYHLPPIISGISMILGVYFFIQYILKPFQQIIQFTRQQVSKNKKYEVKEKGLQLSEIQGSGLAGELVSAYKRLFQGTEGIQLGNSNEIIQRIQKLQYPRSSSNNLDRTSLWKTEFDKIQDMDFNIDRMEHFTQNLKFSEREFTISLQKLKQSRKDTYDFFIQSQRKELKRDISNQEQSNLLQEAILKMIVIDTQEYEKTY